MLQDPGSTGLFKNFKDFFFEDKTDKRRISEAYSYIGSRMSESDWLEDQPSMSMVRLAAQLAWEGHLPSVKNMRLEYMDLSGIPCDQMGKLASKVTHKVFIDLINWPSTYMPSTHLDIILENIRCQVLLLSNMTLTESQTQALVTAMRDRVENVELHVGVTLDIEALCQYNGQGTCWKLLVKDMVKNDRVSARFKRWKTEVDWSSKLFLTAETITMPMPWPNNSPSLTRRTRGTETDSNIRLPLSLRRILNVIYLRKAGSPE